LWWLTTFQFLQQKLEGGHLSISATKTGRWAPFSFCNKNWKVGTFQFLLQKLEGGHLSISAAKTGRCPPFNICMQKLEGALFAQCK
jgi:hypothetical protein